MPTLEVRSVLVALLRVFVVTLLCSVPKIRTQGLPPARPQEEGTPREHSQIFHLSRRLPDGLEMKVYFLKNTPQRLFYTVDDSDTSLQLVVTPCASPIRWALYRGPPSPDNTPEDDFIKEVEGNLSSFVLLGNWSADGRRVFDDPSTPAGLYTLEITATQSDSWVRLLATSTGASHPVYPLLPARQHVDIVRVSRRTFTFRWPDAAAVNVGRPVEYCVSVTKVRNFPTHCSLMAHSKGDKKPVLSKDDQWGFTWEKERMRELRRKARPVKAMSPKKFPIHQCVGTKQEFTFNKARKGKTYYVDVYVVDKVTNKTEAYQGTVVKMPGKVVKTNSSQEIKDGERKVLKLKNDNVPQMVTYQAKGEMALLSVELGVCPGKIPFEIYHNNKRVHRSVVKKWKRVRMKNILPGTYIFKFPRLKRRKSFVSVYVTSRPSALTLPRDMSIKVFDSMTTSTNVTVAWMGTHKRQKYCLYVKEASQIRSLKRHKCSSIADRPKSERVLCMRYKNRDVSKAVMSSTIRGLKPHTSYVVDVYLSRGRSGPVAYKSVSVKTKANS